MPRNEPLFQEKLPSPDWPQDTWVQVQTLASGHKVLTSFLVKGERNTEDLQDASQLTHCAPLDSPEWDGPIHPGQEATGQPFSGVPLLP